MEVVGRAGSGRRVVAGGHRKAVVVRMLLVPVLVAAAVLVVVFVVGSAASMLADRAARARTRDLELTTADLRERLEAAERDRDANRVAIQRAIAQVARLDDATLSNPLELADVRTQLVNILEGYSR